MCLIMIFLLFLRRKEKKKIRTRFAGFRMYSKIIIATVNILLVGVIWDIKAINHCLSVLISVREISEIGSHKSWLSDSTLRLHSSWRYRFIVLKTHSGEWRMRASRRLPTLNLLQGRLAPPTDRRRGWKVVDMIGYRQAAPTPGPCPLLTPNTSNLPQYPAAEWGGGVEVQERGVKW